MNKTIKLSEMKLEEKIIIDKNLITYTVEDVINDLMKETFLAGCPIVKV